MPCAAFMIIISQALLENPALPAHLKEKVLEHSDDALHKVGTIFSYHAWHSDSALFLQHLQDVSTSQTLLATFSAMHDKLAECVRTEEQKTSFIGMNLILSSRTWPCMNVWYAYYVYRLETHQCIMSPWRYQVAAYPPYRVSPKENHYWSEDTQISILLSTRWSGLKTSFTFSS